MKRLNGTQARAQALMKAMIERLDRSEKRMIRSFNAYVKARAALKALEVRLDKKAIGGEYDPRKLIDDIAQLPS